jgi:hypothetical protein
VQVTIEAGNTHFSVVDSFLLDAAGIRLIAYFGSSDEVVVGAKVQIVSKHAFTSRAGVIQLLRFAEGSELRRIEGHAFGKYIRVKAIRLPGSIERLDERWARPQSFEKVIFESGESLETVFAGNQRCLDGFLRNREPTQDGTVVFFRPAAPEPPPDPGDVFVPDDWLL